MELDMKECFDITGMSCAACQVRVEKSVSRLEGVKDVNVNLLKNSMEVEYDENAVSESGIVDAVVNAGYGAIPRTEGESASHAAKAEPRRDIAKEEYEKMRAKAVEEVDTKYGKPFREHYVTSLRKISVEDEDGLFAYIDQQVKEDPNKYYYYRFVVEGLKDKDKTITKVDRSGRIYHCLTNLERELKQYLNIDYMLDCKNSHPLLFNYFIFKYYNISFSSSYNIVLHLKSISFILTDEPIHNVGKFIRKSLIDNNIENASVARMKDDELEYVWLTSTGRLWDDIATRHEMDRNEVKVQMFQEVFYSNTPYAYHWKEYAVEFKEQFPSVYKRIGMWKMRRQANEVKVYMEGRGLKVDKPTTSLSVAMMDLEAQIFTRVLKRLYAKRWNAVHIHDCIVIPKDGNLNHPSIDQVRTIMEDVFKEFGLSPTLA